MEIECDVCQNGINEVISMKINRHDIEFLTNQTFYPKERDGRKPNTTQVIHEDQFEEFRDKFKELKTITIVNSATGERFTRKLVDISADYHNVARGATVEYFIFSWRENAESG